MSVRLVTAEGVQFGPKDRILIVGGGPAGWAAASELRRIGFTGRVMMVGAEPMPPYDRTGCSKGIINGHQLPKDLPLDLRSCPEVIWRFGQRAIGLDPVARRVLLDTGEACAYDGLVIATGSRTSYPKWWPGPGPGLHALHDIADAISLRSALHEARRVAIVGGGLTGCEVACAVVASAREAVVINSQSYLMPRSIGEPVGMLVTAEHQSAGIKTRLGRRVAQADRVGDLWRLRLDDNSVVTADVVVLTAGEQPEVDWLAGGSLDVSDGVLCDESLRVVGAEGVVAAGSIARWPNRRYGPKPERVGQWITALEMGQAAARTLLSGYGAPPAALVPRFWSDQFGLRIQVCGQLDGPAEVGLTELRPGRRHTARSGLVASYTRDGRLVGVVAVNAPRAFSVASRMLVSEPVPSWLESSASQPIPLLQQAQAQQARSAAQMPLAPAAESAVAAQAVAVAEHPERRLRAVQ